MFHNSPIFVPSNIFPRTVTNIGHSLSVNQSDDMDHVSVIVCSHNNHNKYLESSQLVQIINGISTLVFACIS